MSIPFSQVPSDLLMDPDMTLSAVRVWHTVYVETLGRPGWDLSYAQIAEKIGSKRRQTAMDAVTLLIDKGWLIRIRQKADEGDDAPNLFVVCREPYVPWNAEKGVRSSAQGGALSRTRGSSVDRTRGGAVDRTHQKNHFPEESLPVEKSSAPSGDAEGKTVKTVGLDDQEMPEEGQAQRPEKKFDSTPKKGTHGWVLYEWERGISKNNLRPRYNKGHLHRLLKNLRAEGMTNEEIVILIGYFFARNSEDLRSKRKDADLTKLFEYKIPQLQAQAADSLRAHQRGWNNKSRNAEQQEALRARLRGDQSA